MITPAPVPPADLDLRDAVAELTARLERVEARLGMGVPATEPCRSPGEAAPAEPAPGERDVYRDSLELELGQNWFAFIGIAVLSIGMAFVLSRPLPGLPAYLPSVGGFVLSGGMLLLARWAEPSFEAVARYMRGAGMLLMFFSALRLFYFGDQHALETTSWIGRGLLLAVLGLNFFVTCCRRSIGLLILTLLTGYATALAVGSTWFVLGTITLLAAVAVFAQQRTHRRMLTPVGFSLSMAAYVIWAIGNPLQGNGWSIYAENAAAVYVILIWVVLFTISTMRRPEPTEEDSTTQLTGLMLCAVGFGVFVLHNLLAFDDALILSLLVAATLYLWLAVTFWVRERSMFSSFVYAMTGYIALSIALIRAFDAPELFVALSVQSLVVVATAVYFRSRFIIVANCLIFLAIILGYLVATETERGMSLVFGLVALTSARVLNWQKDRLALKTDVMRNTYLIIAFLVFPYALRHLVPDSLVTVAWAGLALFYYAMSILLKNLKYRWMAHLTLLFTVCYVLLIGTRNMDDLYRIVSYLVLGSIMVVVSLVFTLTRDRRRPTGSAQGAP